MPTEPNDDEPGEVPTVIEFPRPFAEPLVTFLSHGCSTSGCSSHVTRVFEPGTGYCGRCPADDCNVHLDVCHQFVFEHLTMDEAERLVTIGRPRRPALPCPHLGATDVPGGRVVGGDQAG